MNSSPTQPARAGTHQLMKSANLSPGIIAHKLRKEMSSISSNSLCSITKPNSFAGSSRAPFFDFQSLPNDLIIKIFQYMNTYELCNLSTVCRRFEKLIWNPMLWRKIILKGD
jgi:hypothetical protein